MRGWIAALLLAVMAGGAQAQGADARMQLWQLDCGDFVMKRFGHWFSDTFQYPPGPRPLVGSCYLIRHGSDYMLWDTGLSDRLIGKPLDNPEQTRSLKRSVLDQLKQLGVGADQIDFVGISHFHNDHTGQARHFTQATLLIGRGDWDALKGTDERLKETRQDLAHWLNGPGKSVPVPGDADVFKDGSVIMLGLPGHTPGHSGLLVRLASGPVLLSGDQ